MNAKKFFAACTAAVLALGFSLGASSAALADEAAEETTEVTMEQTTEVVVEVEQDESETEAAERTVGDSTDIESPVAHNDDHVVGGPHPDNGANRVTLCHATPPDTAAQGWISITIDDDAAATNQAGHDSEHDMDIIPAFEYWLNIGNGNGPQSEWVKLYYPGKNLGADFGGVTGAEILANGCAKPAIVTLAEAGIAFDDPTCDTAQSLKESGFTQVNSSYVITLGPGAAYSVVFTAANGSAFDQSLSGVTDDGAKRTFSGDLLPELTGPLCDDLETFPNWTASASAVDAECEGDNGAILIEPVDGDLENPTPVRYYLNYGEANQSELVSISTPVPAGTYVVTAVVTNLNDSVNDSGTSDEWELTVGVTGEDCEELDSEELTNLASTGAADVSGVLGALAALAMIAGTGLVIRRRAAFTLGA